MAAMVVITIPAATMMVTSAISHLFEKEDVDLDRRSLSVDPSNAAYLEELAGG